MQIPVLLMADLANADHTGKLNVIGIFGQVRVPSVPFTLNLSFLVAQLVFAPNESGKLRRIKMELTDQDGGVVFENGPHDLLVPQPAAPGAQVEIPMVLQINSLEIKKFGPHKWCVMIDDDVKGELSLAVTQADIPIGGNQ